MTHDFIDRYYRRQTEEMLKQSFDEVRERLFQEARKETADRLRERLAEKGETS